MTFESPCARHERCEHDFALVLNGYDNPADYQQLVELLSTIGSVWVENLDTGTL